MFADPKQIVAQFDLQSGSHVADFGAGSGAFTLAAAQAVGDKGRVYAVEVQKELLDRLKNAASEERLNNIEAIWGDVERPGGTHLKPAIADAVIVANTLFQVDDKEGLVAEAARILKQRGKLLLVDWSESFGLPAPHSSRQTGGIGPQPEHVVTERSARELFERGGFTFVKMVEAGAHHYGLLFRR